MVDRRPADLDRVFRALADPTRREILVRIARSDCTVAKLSRPFPISAPAISRHLKVLEDAGLLERVRAGRHHHFHLNPQPLVEVRASLERLTTFWLRRLDELEDFLDAEDSGAKRRAP